MFDNTADVLDHAETLAYEEGFQRAGGSDLGAWVDRDDGTCDFVPAPPRTEQVIREVVLADNNRGRFTKRFDRLAKACARHGQVLSILQWKTVDAPHPLFRNRTVKRNCAVISLPPVVGERGAVIGHFERAEDGKQWYLHIFNEDDTAAVRAFLPRADECDHCGKARRRNQTFVVRTPDGDKLVARQCLLSYCGVDPLAALVVAAAYEASNGESDYDDCWGGGKNLIHVESLVRTAYRVARKLGGYSKDNSAYHVMLVDRGRPQDTDNLYLARKEQEIIDSYKGFDPECDLQALADYVEHATGDFGENLRTVFGLEYAETKRRNLIIAGVGLSVGRVLKREKDAEVKAALPTAKLLDAEVGKRVDLVGTVLRTFVTEGEFGSTCIVAIRCADGTNLVNFHTGSNRPEAGKVYAIRATVKKHGSDRRTNEPQTIITRAVYTEAPAQPALI